jgi:hypothetical protein
VLLNQCPHNLDLWQWLMAERVKLRRAEGPRVTTVSGV